MIDNQTLSLVLEKTLHMVQTLAALSILTESILIAALIKGWQVK